MSILLPGNLPATSAASDRAAGSAAPIGIRPDRDGALGAYTQFGAMVDLAGLRLSHLPRRFVAQVLADHPRGPFKREILRRLELEATAVRGGRFDFVRKVGFGLAVRHAPFPS